MTANRGYRFQSAKSFNGEDEEGEHGLELYEIQIRNNFLAKEEVWEIKFFKTEKEREEYLRLLGDDFVDLDNLKKPTKYKLESIEGEVEYFDELWKLEERFVEYIINTQQEYIEYGHKTKEEVEEHIQYYRANITKNFDFLNETLIDYGFREVELS